MPGSTYVIQERECVPSAVSFHAVVKEPRHARTCAASLQPSRAEGASKEHSPFSVSAKGTTPHRKVTPRLMSDWTVTATKLTLLRCERSTASTTLNRLYLSVGNWPGYIGRRTCKTTGQREVTLTQDATHNL